MAKAELFKNKLFSKLITSLGAFPVERGRGDSNALDKGEQLLKEKHVMGIFIEGTRSKTGEFLKPKSGVSIIAYNCRVPVIPACITKGKFGKRYIQFGEPIPIEHLGFEEGGAKEFRNASRIIFDKIVDLRQQLYASLK